MAAVSVKLLPHKIADTPKASLTSLVGSLLQAGEDSTPIPEDTPNTVWCAALYKRQRPVP
jgi:hypothetical protein